MTEDADFEAHFASLRERFRTGLNTYRERLVAVRNMIATSPAEDTIRRLKGVAHELAGSAGTFGFEEIGETAAVLEQSADRVLAGSEQTTAVIAPLRQLIREVELSL